MILIHIYVLNLSFMCLWHYHCGTDTSEHNCDDEQSWSVDSYWASTLGRSLGIQDIEGQRVIQVGNIPSL
jgi:hypothetical protein